MIRPPIVPPTITPTLVEGSGAEDEADVELGPPRVVAMAEVDNEDKPVKEDEDVKGAIDEEEYADEVLDREDEAKPIGF